MVTAPLVAAVAGAAAAAVAVPAGRRSPTAPPPARPGLLRGAAPAAAAVTVLTLVGGATGIVLAVTAALVVHSWLRLLPSAAQLAHAAGLRRSLPLALDLTAAVLATGATVPAALAAAADAVGDPLGPELRLVAAALRLGTAPAAACARWAGHPDLGALGRVLSRSVEGGTAAVDRIGTLAARAREGRRFETERAARSAGVRAVGPLVCCFLPAFVLVGVVPLVAELLRGLR